MNKPKYRFYATLLDSYMWYLECEKDQDVAEQELIDKINRVPVTDPENLERMWRGTALNNLIDLLLQNKVDGYIANGDGFRIMHEGMMFSFDSDVIMALQTKLHGCINQFHTEHTLSVYGRDVVVYGNVDYAHQDIVIDLKSTKAYELGKYRGGMQRHVYGLCLKGHGFNSFRFLVTDFKAVYEEDYEFNEAESVATLREACDGLVRFIERHKDRITDKKVFGIF